MRLQELLDGLAGSEFLEDALDRDAGVAGAATLELPRGRPWHTQVVTRACRPSVLVAAP